MNFTKTMFALAVGSVGIMGSMSAHAVLGVLNTGDVLSITAGAQNTTVHGAPTSFATGSWFAYDVASPFASISPGEQVLLAQGTNGIVIDSFTASGDFHLGTTHPAGDTATGPVVASFSFNASTGTNYFNSALPGAAAPGGDVAGGGVSNSFNMSAWDFAWATASSFNMSMGSWNVTNPGEVGMSDSNGAAAGSGVYGNGLGRFSWSGIYGDTYTLDYTATDQVTGITLQYALHLTGVVTAVPEASTYGMMLAGLGLVGGMVGGMVARRRKI